MRCGSLLVASLLLPGILSAAGKVWVVDASGGSGSQFTAVQPAIDAASAGDTVLVRSGNYGSVAIQGKGLALVADTGALVELVNVCVEQIPTGQSCTLRGLRVRWKPSVGALSTAGAVAVSACAGDVWIEDCRISGGYIGCQQGFGTTGLSVASSTRVSIARSTLEGSPGQFVPLLGCFAASGAMSGAGFTDSVVFSFESTFIGGGGGGGDNHVYYPGAPGIYAVGGFFHASECTFRGGQPGGCFLWGSATQLVPGASAVALGQSADFFGLGCTYAPTQALWFCCPIPWICSGTDGVAISMATGATAHVAAGPSCAFASSSPQREGQSAQFVLSAVPGALAFLAVSATPEAAYFPEFLGPQLVSFPWLGIVLGTVGASGQLSASVPVGFLPAGLDVQAYYGQAAVIAPGGGLQVCSASALTVLDAQF